MLESSKSTLVRCSSSSSMAVGGSVTNFDFFLVYNTADADTVDELLGTCKALLKKDLTTYNVSGVTPAVLDENTIRCKKMLVFVTEHLTEDDRHRASVMCEH
jgi:hypothetical protein